MVDERTSARRALTTWREMASAVVSVWHWVMVCTTRSIRDGSGRFGGCALEIEARPFRVGDGGGEGSEMGCGEGFVSTKKEYEMSLEMQSKLAMMSFSLRVSQASRRGSNISRGLSPPIPARTSSRAR